MKLRPDISPVEFLQTAAACSGEVLYKTEEGDCLNLKSQLSKYLFLVVFSKDTGVSMSDGDIVCEDPSDYTLLECFLKK